MEKTRQPIVDWQKSLPKNISTRELKIQAKAFFGDHVDRINFATRGQFWIQIRIQIHKISQIWNPTQPMDNIESKSKSESMDLDSSHPNHILNPNQSKKQSIIQSDLWSKS